jgi:glyoxylase-like metal-dependent hydrolase (beta-lactamase superfamily II)
MIQISENLFRFEDTCHVYVVRSGDTATLIDFGSGAVLDELQKMGIRATDVLMTHHHRDQGEGLPRAVRAGIRIWVPHQEQDFFAHAERFWAAREVWNNYNTRQDRYTLLESVPIAGTLKDYSTPPFNGRTFTVIPTPGHTTGSVSLLCEIDGRHVCFTGDLIAGVGKVWSLAATQWSYNGGEGIAATILSALDLKERIAPDVLLPSHGEAMPDPAAAIDALVSRLYDMLQLRQHNLRVFSLRDNPFETITPHLLRNVTSVSNSYILLSESGKALFIDFGYDFVVGWASGVDRSSRRPWLYNLPTLKKQFGVKEIDAVILTHYHDDHVAGCNILRDAEGAEVWAADHFADLMINPQNYSVPCLWYDPIPVDRVLPLEQPIQWEEYTLTLYPIPGHTYYAVAIAFEVDGQRVLAIGDQYQNDTADLPNHVYQNVFRSHDFIDSAELFARLRPHILISGHWTPYRVEIDYFEKLRDIGEKLDSLHRNLQAMPAPTPDPGRDAPRSSPALEAVIKEKP